MAGQFHGDGGYNFRRHSHQWAWLGLGFTLSSLPVTQNTQIGCVTSRYMYLRQYIEMVITFCPISTMNRRVESVAVASLDLKAFELVRTDMSDTINFELASGSK